jgi:FMN phosphatase YigB (HAD superfamily)
VVKNNLGELLELCDDKNVFISTFYGLTKVKDGDKFFNLIIESIPFKTENIFFVDDNVKSIELARSKGINGILFIHDKNSDSWSESNQLLLTEFEKYGLF